MKGQFRLRMYTPTLLTFPSRVPLMVLVVLLLFIVCMAVAMQELAKQDVCEFRRFVCVVQMFQVVDLCELLKGFNCCDEASFTYGYQDY